VDRSTTRVGKWRQKDGEKRFCPANIPLDLLWAESPGIRELHPCPPVTAASSPSLSSVSCYTTGYELISSAPVRTYRSRRDPLDSSNYRPSRIFIRDNSHELFRVELFKLFFGVVAAIPIISLLSRLRDLCDCKIMMKLQGRRTHIFAARAMATRISTPLELSSFNQSCRGNTAAGGISSSREASFGGMLR
jgi:hypothetical protein